MSKFNAGQSFADGDTVTGAKLNNIAGLLDIYTGLISEQTAMSATVSTADQLLIADVDNGDSGAANRVTVQKLLNDTLTNGTFTGVNLTGNLNVAQLSTLGTINSTTGTIATLNSTTGTIQSLTSSTANISQGSAIFTQGTIGTLNVTTGTIGTLNNTTGTIGTFNSTTGTIGALNSTTGTIANLSATTSTFLGAITGSTNVVNIGSEQIYKDAGGQVGVGVIPSAWSSSEYKAIQVGIGGSISGRVLGGDQDKVNVAANVYHDGTSFKYIASDEATIYAQTSGIHIFSNAASGTAGSTATFTERLRIDSSGRVQIGTTQDFGNTTRVEVGFDGLGSEYGIGLNATAIQTATQWAQFTSGTGVARGSIDWSGTAVRYNTSSDYRLKENITGIADGIARIKQLKPSRFSLIEYPEKMVDGFIAHEVSSVVPEAVSGEKDAVNQNGNPIYQGIDQSKIVPLLTAALKEAVAKIEIMEAKVAALEAA